MGLFHIYCDSPTESSAEMRMDMAKKFYAVRVGKISGIYTSWEDCKAVVQGYSAAEYKSFDSMQKAQEYMDVVQDKKEKAAQKNNNGAYAYVDGSYNQSTNMYGYGGFIKYGSKIEKFSGNGNDKEMALMRNVAGEILGSMEAIKRAVELKLPSIDVYYDYMGIEKWAAGEWKRNKKGTKAYYDYIQSVKDKIEIHFIKVKGHSGVEGNEEADKLAKLAVGIKEL